jgi:hypothetical protein
MRIIVLSLVLLVSTSNAFAYSNKCIFYVSSPLNLLLSKTSLEGPLTDSFIREHKFIKIVYRGVVPWDPDGSRPIPSTIVTNTMYVVAGREIKLDAGKILLVFPHDGVGYREGDGYVYVPDEIVAPNPTYTLTVDPEDVLSITGIGEKVDKVSKREGARINETERLTPKALKIFDELMISGSGTGGEMRFVMYGIPSGSLTLSQRGGHGRVFVPNGVSSQTIRHSFENYAKEQGLPYHFNDIIRNRDVTPPSDLETSRQFFLELRDPSEIEHFLEFLASSRV